MDSACAPSVAENSDMVVYRRSCILDFIRSFGNVDNGLGSASGKRA